MAISNKKISFCPHCCNTTPRTIVYSHYYQDKWYDQDGKVSEGEQPESETYLMLCETCDQVSLFDGISSNSIEGCEPKMVYPQSSQLDYCVPLSVRKAYHEAYIVRHNAPNGFAILIRRALEVVCDDRKIVNSNLKLRLERLSVQDNLPTAINEFTDIIRLLGNIGAHPSESEVNPLMTKSIDDFFRAVIEYVYVAPQKIDNIKKQLEKLKK